MVIDNELAWEMTRKALQQHKLNRTPIKLQVEEGGRAREREEGDEDRVKGRERGGGETERGGRGRESGKEEEVS